MSDRPTDRQQQDSRDELLRCSECNKDFVFTAGERRFYLSKCLAKPKRCPICRKARRDSISSDGGW
jgi:hypothetical protein